MNRKAARLIASLLCFFLWRDYVAVDKLQVL
nr:MAG TPA: hypothetical protein [Caudoviricetes sp.]